MSCVTVWYTVSCVTLYMTFLFTHCTGLWCGQYSELPVLNASLMCSVLKHPAIFARAHALCNPHKRTHTDRASRTCAFWVHERLQRWESWGCADLLKPLKITQITKRSKARAELMRISQHAQTKIHPLLGGVHVETSLCYLIIIWSHCLFREIWKPNTA